MKKISNALRAMAGSVVGTAMAGQALHIFDIVNEQREMSRQLGLMRHPSGFTRDHVRVKGVMTLRGRSRYMPNRVSKNTAPSTLTRQQIRAELGRAMPYLSNAELADRRREMIADLLGDDLPTPENNPGVLSPDHRERVGQFVRWTSNNVDKRGVITHVVPAGSLPADVGVKIKDANTPRDHISYIVEGCAVGGRKARYWPRVSQLEIT